MSHKDSKSNTKLEQGKQLASKLYNYKIQELETLDESKKETFLRKFPLLSKTEFNDVLQQAIEVKKYEKERIGWQAIPHDIAVLVMIIITSLINLKTGIVVGISTLSMLESIFLFYFNRKLYHYLSILVWLTYPAYALFAYMLYLQGFKTIWIVIIVFLTWGGSFLIGVLIRISISFFKEAREKAAIDADKLKKKYKKRNDKL